MIRVCTVFPFLLPLTKTFYKCLVAAAKLSNGTSGSEPSTPRWASRQKFVQPTNYPGDTCNNERGQCPTSFQHYPKIL